MTEPHHPPADAGTEGAASGSSRPLSRREWLAGAAGAAAASALHRLVPGEAAAQQAPHSRPLAPADPTRVQGPTASERGERSPFETPAREYTSPYSSRTPLQALDGTLTPADLHFERHHAGIPTIDPQRYELLVHGMVDAPMIFTLEDLRSLPSVTRTCFLECSGNMRTNAPEDTTPQSLCGLTSQSEWTGVPLALVFREVGIDPAATWFLAEGMDAAVLSRSVPVEKAFDDAILAYVQNGEPLRPAQGYPVRLFLPGWEGNASVKWLRRLELSDRPFMTREETSRYTEGIRGGRARQFSWVMDARSVITHPCHPGRVRPGWLEVRGIAWSGRGTIARAELSFDEGATWVEAELQEPVLAKAHTRFRYLWRWDGREATVMSRAVDETGYVQPTIREFIDARGPESGPYHRNPITGWRLRSDGEVVFRTEAWA
jgi:sulfane dehydrogenase subunit SoxC